MLSKQNFQYQKFKEGFKSDPVKTIENDPEMQEYKKVLYPKGILAALVLFHQKKISEDNLKRFVKYLGCVFIQSIKKEIGRFAQLKFSHQSKNISDVIKTEIEAKYPQIFTRGDFSRCFEAIYVQSLTYGETELEWQVMKGLEGCKENYLISFQLLKGM